MLTIAMLRFSSKHLMIGSLAFSACIANAQDWEKADRQTVRLSPSRFPELPTYVRKELERRGCTVPQLTGENKPHNVIHGEFIGKGQQDWAILCSVNRQSAILVFRGPRSDPFRLALRDDFDFLQGAGDDRIVYSRAIDVVGRKYILEHYRMYGGPKPPPIDHQGINDEFTGKASVVFYFYAGKWLQLTGAD